ncbi:MAG: hypothetical protein KDK36_00335, partial [Leptospiraceae bacterium]|nr:hypothetical protein [Leptospiraceae bacterium]
MNITKFIITILLILFNCNSIAHKEILEKYKNLIIDTTPFQNLLENENSKISHLKLNRESEVKSIILHSTGKLSAKEHLNLSLQNDFLYHILISKEGKLFGEKNPAIYHYKLIPSMDASSIHIVM